ncbi:MAG: hydroxyacylglutathione hydrolase [Janthinobacterium lividum]
MPMQSSNSLEIVAVAAFADNYLWLIHDGTHAVVVDPGDAAPVQATLERLGLTLVAILLTHHHPDHVGGVPALLAMAAVPVYGPKRERIDGMNHPLADGDQLHIGELGLHFTVLDVPGHTSGHIAYVETDHQWLFCGDTLFAGGCGRLFEGTPRQMADSLGRLAALPDETAVYCAHEYTLANLKFALAVEPGNTVLVQRMAVETAKRQAGQATLPSSIGLEKRTNPFLRHTEPAIIATLLASKRLASPDALASFTALRQWKDNFR